MLHNEGNVFFIGDFDDSAEQDLALAIPKEIQKQRNQANPRLDFYINSYGGYAHLAFHVIDLMEIAKRLGIKVRTIIPNIAFSAGSMVAIAGSEGERYIARNGEHLIHYGTTGSSESTPKQIERLSAYKSRDFKNTIAHYKKYTDVPDLDNEMMDDGFFVPAAQCIKWGLADKYTDKFDIGYE